MPVGLALCKNTHALVKFDFWVNSSTAIVRVAAVRQPIYSSAKASHIIQLSSPEYFTIWEIWWQ